MIKLALLISGGGTTASAVIKECLFPGRLFQKVKPVLVISSNPEAAGRKRVVETGGIEQEDVMTINPNDYLEENAFGEAIIRMGKSRGVNHIGQYGWMARTPRNVIQAFEGKMTNQHPGPLDIGHPDFGGRYMYGKRVHYSRLKFVRLTKRNYWTEAVCQRVDLDWDKGKVIKVIQVAILPTDDVESLAKRVLLAEHECQIQALLDFAENNVQEIVRTERLVKPEEEELLVSIKKDARLMYPAKG